MNSIAGMPHSSSTNIDQAVERIIQTPDFQASPRISAFLKFIVRETLEGRGAQLKAFSIAVAVYERDESFDPQTSSIVRVEASRLRRLLDRYYEGPGADDDVRITLPRGSYAPAFSLVEKPAEELPSAAKAGLARLLTPWTGAGLAAALIAAAISGFALWPRLQPRAESPAAAATVSMRPAMTIQLPGLEPQDKAATRLQELKLALEGALSASEHVTMIDLAPGRDARVEYRVEIRAPDDDPAVTEVRAIYEASGEILWTRTEAKPMDIALLAQRISTALSQPSGIMFADQRRRFGALAPERKPFNCIIKGYDFLIHPSSGTYKAAADCLDRVVQDFPEYQLAIAMLASIHSDAHIFGFRRDNKGPPLELAIAAAQIASRISSHSVRTKSALFRVQFLEKRYDAAFDTGAKAISEYPGAATILGRLGSAQILRGDYAAGRKKIDKALAINEGLTPMMAPFQFIAAYMTGDQRAASQWASNRMSHHASPLLLIGRIIIAHQRGEIDNVQRWSKRLRERFPEFATDIPAGVQRYGANDEILARMLGELRQAGVIAPDKSGQKQ